MDLISVIVPVYNVEKYLENCIDSIINQTYKNLEIVLIDDGSTDNSPQICDEYALKDNRIKVIHKKNGGLSDARNIGISNSNGNYLMFIDSDDFIHEEMVRVLYELLLTNNADMSICNFSYYFDKDVNIDLKYIVSPIKDEILSRDDAIKKLLEPKSWYYVVACTKLYKKSLWQNIKFPLGYIHEDEAVIHRLMYECEKIVSTDRKLYYYRQTPGSIMNSGLNARHLDLYVAMADRIKFLKNRIEKKQLFVLFYHFIHNYTLNYFQFYGDKSCKKYIKRMKKSLVEIFPIMIFNNYLSFKDSIGILLLIVTPGLYKKIIYGGKNK